MNIIRLVSGSLALVGALTFAVQGQWGKVGVMALTLFIIFCNYMQDRYS